MKLLIILFSALFFKSLIWWLVVPPWQAPDEQAHFVQLQWYAEKKTLQIAELNLSREVALSEELLGTKRDNFGNNKYTYHPDYKIAYAKNFNGINEGLINSQPLSARTAYVGREAAGYPPLYYQLALPLYNLFYKNGLMDRLFAVRLLSLISHLLLAFVAFLVGREIWGKGLAAIALAVMVAFQPMVSFLAAGFHPDNLLNLLYSLGILVCLRIIKNGLKPSYLAVLALVIFLGMETKILMVFFLPVAGAVIIFSRFRGKLAGGMLAAGLLLLPLAAFILQWPIPYMPVVTAASPLRSLGITKYLRFRVPKMVFEMWPWYWGVFKWLGVTLPPLIMKIITRVAALAGLGIFIYFVKVIRSKKISFETRALGFFLISSVSYILYLFFWDWRLMQSTGFSQGLQGRYLFSNIIPAMAVILIGLKSLIPPRFIFAENLLIYLLMFGMIALNFIALGTVARSYYDLTGLKVFITQLSQYHPGLLKANNLIFFGVIYILSLVWFLWYSAIKFYPFKNGKFLTDESKN